LDPSAKVWSAPRISRPGCDFATEAARSIAIKMAKAAGAAKAADCLAAWRRQGESGRLWFGLVSIGVREVRLQPSQRQNSAG
jgi:hypothetical protein